ncbi:MAG: DUF481 domain-containing protein [Chromatiales bacterium]|nr:DUF481 domain-containing protein [Chromatiales bacterium]
MRSLRMIVAMLLMTSCVLAHADELYLNNGSKLIGSLVRAGQDSVIFNTPFAGDITIKQSSVARIVTEDRVIIMMDDGTVYRDRRIDSEGEQLVAKGDDGVSAEFDTVDIQFINPEPWRLGEGYKWSGEASVAAEFERGNSDTDEWDIEGNTVWRSLVDRYTIKGDFERDRNNGQKTDDNWEVRSKYDRFSKSDDRNYWGGKLRFEYDRFADLDLRTILGPHIGRQFFDTPRLAFHGEIGPVYVDEQFDEAEDNDFPGALWEGGATSDIVGFGSTLYLNHDGILNFDDPDDLILNTTLGLKFPLILGFEAGVQAKWEYDGGAPGDVDELDETYTFRLGYAW